MDEIFPMLGGAVLGLAAAQLSVRLRWLTIVLLAPLIAFTASKISGEFDLDWRFVLVDGAVALIAAVLAAHMGQIAIAAMFSRR